MMPQLLTVRALIDRAIATARDSLHSTPGLHETIQSLRTQLGAVLERLVLAMQLTSLRGAYSTAARVFIKLARLCIEALDWLLLPRLAWKITARHCVALLVLYFVKVFFNVCHTHRSFQSPLRPEPVCITPSPFATSFAQCVA